MLFRQITHEDLGCASYLVGDEDAGVAAVVDPRLDVEEYLAPARYAGVRIEHVLETHDHADHVSGHGRRDGAVQLLDVREEDERRAMWIPGSAWRAYHDLDAVPGELDPARPIAAICASGQRAAVVASLLAHHGPAHPIQVTGGGVGTWERHGWVVEHGAR